MRNWSTRRTGSEIDANASRSAFSPRTARQNMSATWAAASAPISGARSRAKVVRMTCSHARASSSGLPGHRDRDGLDGVNQVLDELTGATGQYGNDPDPGNHQLNLRFASVTHV